MLIDNKRMAVIKVVVILKTWKKEAWTKAGFKLKKILISLVYNFF